MDWLLFNLQLFVLTVFASVLRDWGTKQDGKRGKDSWIIFLSSTGIFLASYKVEGRWFAEVEASSLEEAKRLAEDKFYATGADFMRLLDESAEAQTALTWY